MKLWLDGKDTFKYFYSLRYQKPLSHVNSTWASQQGCAANHTVLCRVLPHLCKAILLQLFLCPLWRQFKGCNFPILTSLPCSWSLSPHLICHIDIETQNNVVCMVRTWTWWSSWSIPGDTITSEVLQYITNIPMGSPPNIYHCPVFCNLWLSSHGSMLTPKGEPSPFQSCLCASGQWEAWRDLPASSASCPRPLRCAAPAPAGLHGPRRKGQQLDTHTHSPGALSIAKCSHTELLGWNSLQILGGLGRTGLGQLGSANPRISLTDSARVRPRWTTFRPLPVSTFSFKQHLNKPEGSHTNIWKQRSQKKLWRVPSEVFKWETELDCSNVTFKRNISIVVFPLVGCGAISQERNKETDLVYTDKSLWMSLLKSINSIWNNTEHISYTDRTMDNKGKSQQIHDVFYRTRSAEMGNNYPMATTFPVWKELSMGQSIKTCLSRHMGNEASLWSSPRSQEIIWNFMARAALPEKARQWCPPVKVCQKTW